MGFGEVNFDGDNQEGNFKKKKRFSLGEGTTVFRVLPPMFSLEGTQKWYARHKVHFGYKGVNKKNPAEAVYRPFLCVEQGTWNNTTNKFVVSQPCPQCEKIKEMKELKQQQEVELKKQGKTGEELKKGLEQINNWLRTFNLDNKYHLNVKMPNNEFGKIKLPQTVFKNLKEEFDKLGTGLHNLSRKTKLNPVSPSAGVWVAVTRKGGGFLNTEYSPVEFLTEDVTVQDMVIPVIKKAPLTEADYKQALDDCWDLSDPGAAVLTVEQVQQLVNSSGDPEDVDAIFNRTQYSVKLPETGPVNTSGVKMHGQPPTSVQEPTATTSSTTMTEERFRKEVLDL